MSSMKLVVGGKVEVTDGAAAAAAVVVAVVSRIIACDRN